VEASATDPDVERWQPAIAAAWARRGRWDRALEVLASFPGTAVAINCALSSVCAADGAGAEARQRARAAVEAADAICDASWRWHERAAAAAGLARAGAPRDAADRILGWERPPAAPRSRPTDHALGLLTVAEAAVDASSPGDAQRLVDAAMMLAGHLSGQGWKDDVQSAVAVTRARLGSWAASAESLGRIQDPWSSTEAHVGVCRAALVAGAAAEAERAGSDALVAAREVGFIDWREEATANAVVAATDAGVLEAADRTLELIVDPVWRAETLLRTAASRPDAWTRVDEARRIADQVGYGWWAGRGGAVAAVVAVHLGRGDLVGAADWLARPGHPRVAADILWQVTDRLRRTSDAWYDPAVRSFLSVAAGRLGAAPAAVAVSLELA
jgi:hypothetical protein